MALTIISTKLIIPNNTVDYLSNMRENPGKSADKLEKIYFTIFEYVKNDAIRIPLNGYISDFKGRS